MAEDNKDTTLRDRRILGIRFVLCGICGRPIRESEAVEQRGVQVCPEDVDIMDHEGEV